MNLGVARTVETLITHGLFVAQLAIMKAGAAWMARFSEPEVIRLIIRLMGDDLISSATRIDPRLAAFYRMREVK